MFGAGVAAATGDPRRDITIQEIQPGVANGIVIHAVIGVKEQFSGIQNMESDSFKQFLASKLAQNGILGATSKKIILDYRKGKIMQQSRNTHTKKVKRQTHNITNNFNHHVSGVSQQVQVTQSNYHRRLVIGILVIVVASFLGAQCSSISRQDHARVIPNAAMPDGEEESTPILFQQNPSGYAMPYDEQSADVDQSMASPI